MLGMDILPNMEKQYFFFKSCPTDSLFLPWTLKNFFLQTTK